jgi:diguanylate cyclase (GGDEF)-like protein
MIETSLSAAKQRLLIVDDQPANIRVMAEALREDYELFFATSGKRALEIVATGNIDLVLLDVVMPDLDGFEVCRQMKSDETTSRIPVIFVTAREEVDDETRGFNVGGVDYIAKPIRPPIVRARVQTHLELKHARDLLESLASIDALTGIANRRQFDASLEAEFRRCVRVGAPLSLAMIDVDHFKKFNDTYGHAHGDACLRAVARSIQSVARRPGDVAARYGGEEFGLILPHTDGASALAVLRHLLEEIASLSIPHSAAPAAEHLTISAGAVTIVPSESDDAASIVAAADRLLYDAKENGRNHAVHVDLMTNKRERIDAPR